MTLLHKDTKKALIRSLPLFAECNRDEIAQVAAIADEIDFPAGRTLAVENAVGREFVVIAEGSATVLHGEKPVATLAAGDFFGEIALMTGRPRTASVVAQTDVRALVIEVHAFLTLMESAPEIRAKVQRAMAERTTTAS
ncbi:MAG: Crp/Fnr family transcriptional regulator [Marmoricola sp.]|nr:Crp/Fnr family transcriptional regulator [Marmoricola sp.]